MQFLFLEAYFMNFSFFFSTVKTNDKASQVEGHINMEDNDSMA
jgi:hypothetical protein